jgi:hypothetical protein
MEVSDMQFSPQCDDNSIGAESRLKQMCDLIVTASENIGRPINTAELYKSQLEAAGFKNVVEVKYQWPLNTWPLEEERKVLGTFLFINLGSFHILGLWLIKS